MREIMKLGPILIALCFSNLTLGQLIRTNTPATGISYIGNALLSTDNIIYVCWVEDSLNNPSPSPNDDEFKIIGFCKSNDLGLTWSQKMNISIGDSYSMLNPQIASDDNGKIYLTCTANRIDSVNLLIYTSDDWMTHSVVSKVRMGRGIITPTLIAIFLQ